MKINGKELRQVPSAPHYYISATGEVWSTHRNQWIKQRKGTSGYMRVNVSEEGKMWSPEIHRMIAEAWLERPEGTDTVCHKDDDIYNNCVENLYWGTKLTNAIDKFRNGYVQPSPQYYKDNPKEYKVYKEGEYLGSYNTIQELADALGMKYGRVAHNVRGDRTNKLGYQFEVIEKN
jgi:hypothetical protein